MNLTAGEPKPAFRRRRAVDGTRGGLKQFTEKRQTERAVPSIEGMNEMPFWEQSLLLATRDDSQFAIDE